MKRISTYIKEIEHTNHDNHTECIKKRCVCWKYCSANGHVTPKSCTHDLSSHFWEAYKGETGYSLGKH